jgi:hypothetical protein
MNPLSWKRTQLFAWALFCVAGALCGLGFAWLDSPFHALCRGSISGEWANCTRVLGMWLQYPSVYWPMMLYGALAPGLIFYGVQIARR